MLGWPAKTDSQLERSGTCGAVPFLPHMSRLAPPAPHLRHDLDRASSRTSSSSSSASSHDGEAEPRFSASGLPVHYLPAIATSQAARITLCAAPSGSTTGLDGTSCRLLEASQPPPEPNPLYIVAPARGPSSSSASTCPSSTGSQNFGTDPAWAVDNQSEAETEVQAVHLATASPHHPLSPSSSSRHLLSPTAAAFAWDVAAEDPPPEDGTVAACGVQALPPPEHATAAAAAATAAAAAAAEAEPADAPLPSAAPAWAAFDDPAPTADGWAVVEAVTPPPAWAELLQGEEDEEADEGGDDLSSSSEDLDSDRPSAADTWAAVQDLDLEAIAAAAAEAPAADDASPEVTAAFAAAGWDMEPAPEWSPVEAGSGLEAAEAEVEAQEALGLDGARSAPSEGLGIELWAWGAPESDSEGYGQQQEERQSDTADLVTPAELEAAAAPASEEEEQEPRWVEVPLEDFSAEAEAEAADGPLPAPAWSPRGGLPPLEEVPEEEQEEDEEEVTQEMMPYVSVLIRNDQPLVTIPESMYGDSPTSPDGGAADGGHPHTQPVTAAAALGPAFLFGSPRRTQAAAAAAADDPEAACMDGMSMYSELLAKLAAASPRLRALPCGAWGDLEAVAGALAADLEPHGPRLPHLPHLPIPAPPPPATHPSPPAPAPAPAPADLMQQFADLQSTVNSLVGILKPGTALAGRGPRQARASSPGVRPRARSAARPARASSPGAAAARPYSVGGNNASGAAGQGPAAAKNVRRSCSGSPVRSRGAGAAGAVPASPPTPRRAGAAAAGGGGSKAGGPRAAAALGSHGPASRIPAASNAPAAKASPAKPPITGTGAVPSGATPRFNGLNTSGGAASRSGSSARAAPAAAKIPAASGGSAAATGGRSSLTYGGSRLPSFGGAAATPGRRASTGGASGIPRPAAAAPPPASPEAIAAATASVAAAGGGGASPASPAFLKRRKASEPGGGGGSIGGAPPSPRLGAVATTNAATHRNASGGAHKAAFRAARQAYEQKLRAARSRDDPGLWPLRLLSPRCSACVNGGYARGGLACACAAAPGGVTGCAGGAGGGGVGTACAAGFTNLFGIGGSGALAEPVHTRRSSSGGGGAEAGGALLAASDGWSSTWRTGQLQEAALDAALADMAAVFAANGAPLNPAKAGPFTYELYGKHLRLKLLPDGRLAVRRGGGGWEDLAAALARLPTPPPSPPATPPPPRSSAAKSSAAVGGGGRSACSAAGGGGLGSAVAVDPSSLSLIAAEGSFGGGGGAALGTPVSTVFEASGEYERLEEEAVEGEERERVGGGGREGEGEEVGLEGEGVGLEALPHEGPAQAGCGAAAVPSSRSFVWDASLFV
ncbi:hypothetical protein HYH03_007649 [Edaphochlamys debaryana]|uniref:Uncharacterized protein n=1 Tax=Edaphochlamys debaryana TaxID=47281 RepID=A0A835Y1P4_9CHLO|nr:hypothetical protein HYH03_007649 [Edaphochlamys debaryana]|eukprot:KAG2494296.1 hypothetical protein HYH03_007649 [Edaphochlamys debaryana]